jgi:protein-disulfide isomerase
VSSAIEREPIAAAGKPKPDLRPGAEAAGAPCGDGVGMPQRRLIAAVLAVAAGLAAVLALMGVLAARTEPAAPAATPAATDLFAGIPQRGAVLGKANAPVTLVEFADLQCPYCARWGRETLPTVVRDYVRTGRLRLAFGGMAFVGPDSERALRAVLAAGRQGRLWQMVHALYAAQGAENSGWVTDDVLRQSAASAGAKPGQLLAALPSVDAELQSALARARSAGVRATPTFALVQPDGSLLGLRLSALDPPAFREAIEQYLE